jgi:hypothetical protein
MAQIWELGVKKNSYNKDEYQAATVTILELTSEPKVMQYGTFQNCTVLSQSGNAVQASLFFKKGEPVQSVSPSQLKTPIDCRVKKESSSGAGSVDGYKYTIMLDNGGTAPKSNTPSGQSGGKYEGAFKNPAETRRSICLKYANDLVCNGKIQFAEVLYVARSYTIWVEFGDGESKPSSNCPI